MEGFTNKSYVYEDEMPHISVSTTSLAYKMGNVHCLLNYLQDGKRTRIYRSIVFINHVGKFLAYSKIILHHLSHLSYIAVNESIIFSIYLVKRWQHFSPTFDFIYESYSNF